MTPLLPVFSPSRGLTFSLQCLQFALKTYNEGHTDIYNTEVDNFQGVGTLKGVVDYFGSFGFMERDNTTMRHTKNILLEYGELDLDEYLASLVPPVLNSEIIDFWASVFAVATTLKEFHNIEVPGAHGEKRPFGGFAHFLVLHWVASNSLC
jgi:hypothetical protein